MAITISGENNNDRILASDGDIDQISGINFSGIITASHIDVGSNIQLGNAGIITATTFVGNVTGNVNSTSPLLLQTGGSERFRITGNNELGIAGANYGSAGQVLTSGGSGSAVSWTTPAAQTTIVNYADNKLVTATGNATSLNAEANLTWDGATLYAAGSDAQLKLYDTTASSENSAIRIMAYNGVNYIQSAKSFESDSKADLIFSSYAGATQYLRLKSTGQLNLGTSTAVQTQSNYKAQFETGTNKKISFYSVTHDDLSNEGSGIAFSRQNDGSDLLSGIFSHDNGGLAMASREDMVFLTGGGSGIQQTEEAVRITVGKQTRMGNANNLALWGQNNRLQVAGTDWNTSGVSIACMGTSGSANLILGNSRASTPGGSGSALVQDSRLGYIAFVGDDGTDMHTIGAAISAELNSNASSNSMPAKLRFYTGGNASSNERLRINSDGKINIGTLYNASTTHLDIRFDDTTAYSNTSNHVNGLKIFNDCSTDNGFAGIEIAATDGDDYYGSTLLKSVADGTNYSNDFVIQTRHSGNYNERFRINSDGNIGVGNFSGTNIPQTLSVFGNMYMRQGDYLTWNNGDCQIRGISGYHLQFSTYNGSSMTEAMQLKSDSSLYLPKGLTNRYGMYEVATGGTLNPSSATTWTWNFITQSGTGSVFKIEAYFNHWNTNSNYWSYQEHIVMHRDAHTNYAGFDIRRHAGGLGSWATEILTNTGNNYNEKIRVKWNVGSGSAYMGGYYIRISTPNAIDPESLVVA